MSARLTDVHVILKRSLFVISGDWAIQYEEKEEQRGRNSAARPQRSTTISQTVGRGGRRRAKALWFTMETTPGPASDDSFLPSMAISPMAFKAPGSPRSQPSPSSYPPLPSQRLHKKPSEVTLTSVGGGSLPENPSPDVPSPGKGGENSTGRSTVAEMEFLRHDPATSAFHGGGMLGGRGRATTRRLEEVDGLSERSVYSVAIAK
ncbi:hypothetical protein BU17DRAFT_70077 [Hysterangium stoloniferum]|nr:hypothetical protein BU17DRAFT_70077 [Hysterangium stoloniferum]